MLRRLVAVLWTITAAPCAFAGAWVQPVGQGLAIAQATYYSADSYYDTRGSKQPQATYDKFELQPYLEYGATDWLTVGGSAYLQSVHQSGIDNYGIADPEFFARTRLWHDDKQVLSLQPYVKFGSRFADDSPPRGGSTSHDLELSALYGRNLHVVSDRDYLDTRIGYRLRDHGLSNQWRADAALGLSVTDRIQLVPAVRAVVSTDLKDAAIFSESGDLDYDSVKAELAGLYHLNEQQWLQATLFKDVAGVQTGDGYGISLGFAQRF